MGYRWINAVQIHLLAVGCMFFAVSEASSQTFLACPAPEARPDYSAGERELNYLVKRLSGDDTVAFLGVEPHIQLIDSARPNAFSSPDGTLSFTTGILDKIQSRDERAFVVGHELAHLALKHSRMGLNWNGDIEREMAADRLAVKLMSEEGFNPSAALSLLARLQGTPERQNEPNRVNSSLTRRIEALNHVGTAIQSPFLSE